METAEQSESAIYRAIVCRQGGAEILVVPSGHRFALPEVAIRHGKRIAERFTELFETGFGKRVVCLFVPDATRRLNQSIIHYIAAEHWRDCKLPQIVTAWVPSSAMSQGSFVDPFDYRVVRQSFTEIRSGEHDSARNSFARLGWFEELREWTGAAIEPHGLHVTDHFRQLNASRSFSLVRFETNGPSVWFKAVGYPNQRELPITCALARLFPKYLPTILATHPVWNGWLAQEAEGTSLAETKDVGLWEATATAMAKLQIESAYHSASILASDVRDLRVTALSNRLWPFMEAMEQLMGQQTKSSPPVLCRKELSLLGERIQEALETLRDGTVPDTLGHLDLNPGNIVTSPAQCVFLDWAEAFVGNPFFSFQYLLEHFRRTISAATEDEARLVAAYVEAWEQLIARNVIVEALACARLLAVFAYAVGNDAWADQERLSEPSTGGYLRSLTRRMNREANERIDWSSPCLR